LTLLSASIDLPARPPLPDILLPRSPAHPSLHSFPTRRSSDLYHFIGIACAIGLLRTLSLTGLRLFGVQFLRQCTRGFRQFLGLRSEEHTSELQSRENLVCRLLLEKKKKTVLVSSIIDITENRR